MDCNETFCNFSEKLKMSRTFLLLKVWFMDENIRINTIKIRTTEDFKNLHKHEYTYFNNLDRDSKKYFQ